MHLSLEKTSVTPNEGNKLLASGPSGSHLAFVWMDQRLHKPEYVLQQRHVRIDWRALSMSVCLSVCLPVCACVRACVCVCVYVCRPYVRMYVVCTFVLDQRGLHRKSALTVGMYVQGACVVYQGKIMLLGDLPVGGGDGGGGHGVWTWGRPDRQRNISGNILM